MKKNFEIGDLFIFKHGGIHQLIIDIQKWDKDSEELKLVVQQIGGSQNGLITFYSESSLRMRYNKVG